MRKSGGARCKIPEARYGRLSVMCRDNTPRKNPGSVRWLCLCDCGKITSVRGTGLRHKNHPIRSCGCEWSERLTIRNTKHGMYGTPAYWSILGNIKRARKLQAMPSWADEKQIKEIYKNRPNGFDVDHIVPLTSNSVCGLHIPANLQYLPSYENQSKKNRYWPGMGGFL